MTSCNSSSGAESTLDERSNPQPPSSTVNHHHNNNGLFDRWQSPQFTVTVSSVISPSLKKTCSYYSPPLFLSPLLLK
ncbi:hypothetical protein Hanom_Chr14g01251421 [Helianthus anomalus]